MRKIDTLLAEYAVSHQTKLNIAIHYICVPLIFFSLIGLLASIPIPNVITNTLPVFLMPYAHLGTIVLIFGLFYYLKLSKTLFAGMLFFSVIVLLAINYVSLFIGIPLWLSMLIIFVLAWVGQFIGHNHEGKKPSFLKDLQFLMIGPAWTMSHLFDALNIKF